MTHLDWLVLAGTLIFIVGYGMYKTREQNNNIEDFIGGGKRANWLTIGLSVMATQASAITFLSTPGQAFHDGMGFLQIYFGLPLAVVIVCLVFIPIYHKLKVLTAYEFLENRFDLKTRTLAAALFLVQRGLAAGITIFAPAIVLSSVLGWDLRWLNIIIGLLVILYTVSGGTQAVNITQKQQMFVILLGMAIAFGVILNALPSEINLHSALKIAGENGKMNILNFSFDLSNRYTVWSGILGGIFLSLSYFGTDQSQVQRYLSGRSLKESQWGLLFNGLLKIPMQFFILLVGVMVFVFYQFETAPLHFNPTAVENVMASPQADDFKKLTLENEQTQRQIRALLIEKNEQNSAQLKALQALEKTQRNQAKSIITMASPQSETNDKDYVFLSFILGYMPKGLIGLLLAVILSAAMSSTASELNALAATTTVDLYKRNHTKKLSEKHYLKAGRWFTFLWGIVAILFACIGTLFDNLIQLVNIVGSIFYGTILGIFLLAFFFKNIRNGVAFWAACVSQLLVIIIFKLDWVGYLWLNFIGAFATITLAHLFNSFSAKKT